MKIRLRRPVLLEFEGGKVIKSVVVVSAAEQLVDIAMKHREHGWAPYRVRFDDAKAAWIVSTLPAAP